MESQLYPNNPVTNPNKPSSEIEKRKNQRRELFKAEVPALKWAINYLNEAIKGYGDINNVSLDLANPQAVAIEVASMKQTAAVLKRIKAEMERRMQESED